MLLSMYSRVPTRGMKKTYPATSLTTSRTKAVRLLRWPLVRETRGLTTRGVVFYIFHKPEVSLSSSSIVCGASRKAEILQEVRRS